MPAPNRLRLSVYNEAGERVRLLFDGGASEVGSRLALSASAVMSGDPAGVTVSLPGTLTAAGPGAASLTWRLDNDGGQAAGGGIYYIKAEYQDPFGHTSSLIEPVQVIPAGGQDRMRVYNGAGELVWSRPLPYGAASLDLPPGFVVQADALGGAPGPLGVKVVDETGAVHISDWDGRNDLGQPLDSGSYVVQLLKAGPGGDQVLEARSVVLLKAPPAGQALAGALIAPSPLKGSQPARLAFQPVPGGRLEARVYNVAGELVLRAEGDAGSGSLWLPAQGLAPGVFAVRLILTGANGVREVRNLKWACVH